ncbi:transporter [Xanthobacter sediminis]
MKAFLKLTTSGAMVLMATATDALADSQMFPGISTGVPIGAPLPEGVYAVVIPSFGSRQDTPQVDVTPVGPWLLWSTPWTILGGRLIFDTVTPYANVDVHGGPEFSGFSNTLFGAKLAYDLGGGWYGALLAGFRTPVRSDIGQNYTSAQGAVAFSYLADGWNLSATFIAGTGRSGTTPATGGADWLNLDLTATKKFGKWEVGAVAFGNTDLSSPFVGYAKQSQTAAGGLVGYDFGAFNVQLKVTSTITEQNYGGRETRVWANIFIPLWVANPPSVVTSEY